MDMRRLAALTEHLRQSGADRVELSLDAIERIIGSPLVPSARAHAAFWSNSTKNAYSPAWLDAGYRASVAGRWPGAVVFRREAEGDKTGPRPSARLKPVAAAEPTRPTADPTAVLVGCVSRKVANRAPAKDLYDSPLFVRRRRYAETSGKPWAILSAKYGLLDPDTVVAPYDESLDDLGVAERGAWAARVQSQLDRRFGPLQGKTFEVHAGSAYVAPLRKVLAAVGSALAVRLEGLGIGEQLHWYDQRPLEPPDMPIKDTQGRPQPTPGLALAITTAFMTGTLDLSARQGTPSPGWAGMPEVVATDTLQRLGATPSEIRVFITLCAAMDRARDADRLWNQGARLFAETRWCFDPGEVARRPLRELADALRSFGVSQRHTTDAAAWRVISESLTDPDSAPVAHRAVFAGFGEAGELLEALQATTNAGNPLFPMLAGPKVGPMWVRMLAVPGGAEIAGIGTLPVAVDVQVRKVTEYLGVTGTSGQPLDQTRRLIQAAWRADVETAGAEGPAPLRNTSAALDPALWFFAKWGCTYCERAARQLPVHTVCEHCRFQSNRHQDHQSHQQED